MRSWAAFLAGLLPLAGIAGWVAYDRLGRRPAHPFEGLDVAGLERRLAASGLGRERGSADAARRIVEVGDYGCRFCGALDGRLGALISDAVDRGAARHVAYSVRAIAAEPADLAAGLADCVAEQSAEGYWSFRRRLYGGQEVWLGAAELGLDGLVAAAELRREAEAYAGDAAELERCLEGSRAVDRMEAGYRAAVEAGLVALPLVAVDGEPIWGATLEELAQRFVAAMGSTRRAGRTGPTVNGKGGTG